jgi:hypothetical protein
VVAAATRLITTRDSGDQNAAHVAASTAGRGLSVPEDGEHGDIDVVRRAPGGDLRRMAAGAELGDLACADFGTPSGRHVILLIWRPRCGTGWAVKGWAAPLGFTAVEAGSTQIAALTLATPGA